MKRLLCLSFVLFLTAACGDTADSDRSGTDGSLTNLDTGAQDDLNGLDFGAADRGSPDQGGTEDATTDSTSSPDETAQDGGSSDTGSVFVSSGDVYSPGPLSVTRRRVTASASSAPYDLDLYEPDGTGTYPVVIFQHGFILSIDAYVDMLEHLASHGFVVVCPQLYGPSMIPIGQPSTTDEVEFARELRAWVLDGLANETSATIRTDLLGYAGHSRGAKVAWMLLDSDPAGVLGIAGVDPVDSPGPLGTEPRSIDGDFDLPFPSLVIGTGLGPESAGAFGMACAPEGDNHEQFFDASASPAYHIVMTEVGHMDMLDQVYYESCGMTCSACVAGTDQAGARQMTWGALTAFFRGALQGDTAAFDILGSDARAPTVVTLDQK